MVCIHVDIIEVAVCVCVFVCVCGMPAIPTLVSSLLHVKLAPLRKTSPAQPSSPTLCSRRKYETSLLSLACLDQFVVFLLVKDYSHCHNFFSVNS